MNAFSNASMVEAQSRVILKQFLQDSCEGLVFTDKGKLAKLLQEIAGDVLVNKNGSLYSIELKAEQSNLYGNLFIETWSNRNLENAIEHATIGSNPGWIYKSRADFLFYHFINTKELYVINFFRLKQWCFYDYNLFKYPEKVQKKYTQKNDTWGVCVPIEDIMSILGKNIQKIDLSEYIQVQ